jgi:sporulation protein YlmC with PRC-barrel domain
MKLHSFAALAVALTAFTAPIAFGQDTSSSHDQIHSSQQKSFGSSSALQSSESMKDLKQVRASKLIGVSVSTKDGQNLGQVQDLILDPATGKVRFALVSEGFMAGVGEKMIPVPWQAISVRSEREFALNVDKSKLQSAPAWSQSEMDQPDYVIRVYRFYELEPQSDVGTPGESGQQSGAGQGGSSNQQHQQSSQPAPKE